MRTVVKVDKLKSTVLSFKILLALVAIFHLLGCDAGIFYSPKDWTGITKRGWSKTIGPVDFSVFNFGGLTGQWWTGLEIDIVNHSDRVFNKNY
jgi:hypothetical protein